MLLCDAEQKILPSQEGFRQSFVSVDHCIRQIYTCSWRPNIRTFRRRYGSTLPEADLQHAASMRWGACSCSCKTCLPRTSADWLAGECRSFLWFARPGSPCACGGHDLPDSAEDLQIARIGRKSPEVFLRFGIRTRSRVPPLVVVP